MSTRTEDMKKMRFEERKTLDEIAEEYGISKQRVQQLTGKAKDGWNRSEKAKEKSRLREAERAEFAASHPEMTTQELAVALGISPKANRASKYWKGIRHVTNATPEAEKGLAMEEHVSKMLTRKGIPHRLTNSRPVDIVLADGRTVEVRSRWKPENLNRGNRYSENFFYFPMNRERRAGKPLADIYIFVICQNGWEPDCFIIPAEHLPELLAFGFCWPRSRDRGGAIDWTQYLDQWDFCRPQEQSLWQGESRLVVAKEQKSSANKARK